MNIKKIIVHVFALMMFANMAQGMSFDHMTKDQLNETLIAEYQAGNFSYAVELTKHGASIQSLIDRGKDVNAKGRLGSTLLHWAAFYGYTEQAEFLMAAGANALIKNDNGDTPLDLASMRLDHYKIINKQHVDEKNTYKEQGEKLKKWAQENPEKAQAVRDSYNRRLKEYKKVSNKLKINQKYVDDYEYIIDKLNPWIEELGKQRKKQKEDIIDTYKKQRNNFKANGFNFFVAHMPPHDQILFEEQEVRNIFFEVDKEIKATSMTGLAFAATGAFSFAFMVYCNWSQTRRFSRIAQTAEQTVEKILADENNSVLTLQEQFDIESLLKLIKSDEKQKAFKAAIEAYDLSLKAVYDTISSEKYYHQTPEHFAQHESELIQKLNTDLETLKEAVSSCRLEISSSWKKLFGVSGLLACAAAGSTWYYWNN